MSVYVSVAREIISKILEEKKKLKDRKTEIIENLDFETFLISAETFELVIRILISCCAAA